MISANKHSLCLALFVRTCLQSWCGLMFGGGGPQLMNPGRFAMLPIQSSKRSSFRVSSLVLLICALAGFAMQKPDAGKGPDTAVTLAYQFPEGKTVAYRQTSSETQNVEAMGQQMGSQTDSAIEFSAKQKGSKDGQFTLGVTINALKVNSQSQQGNYSADTSADVGKSFDMVVSHLGKDIDTSGASAIQYELGSNGKQDLSGNFQTFFPDLPERAVKIGDTWPSEDKVTDKVGSNEIHIALKNVHTLEAFETVDGFDCVRIKTVVKGTMAGDMEQGGVGLSINATIEGTGTWYFAIKEGIFVKSDSKGTVAGSIAVGEPANMTLPFTGDMHSEIRLIQK
jgi:hypothetical protein